MKMNTANRFTYRAAFAAAVLLLFCSLAGRRAMAAGSEARTVRIPCGITDVLKLDADGNPTGCCADYLEELALVNNWTWEYVECSWQEAVEMLQSGELDILFPTSYQPDRLETMDFSALAGGYTANGLFVRADSNYYYEDYDSLDGARIAVTRSASTAKLLEEFAASHGFTYTAVFMNTLEEKIDALAAGKVDAVLSNSTNDIPDSLLVSVMDAAPFYYTVKSGNQELLEELDSGMQTLLASEPDLVSETNRVSLVGNNSYSLALTREEAEFLETDGEIIIGFYEDSEPLAYVTDDGAVGGILSGILDCIRDNTSLTIAVRPISRQESWKTLLSQGEIDFYFGASELNVKTDEELLSTVSILNFDNVLIATPESALNTLDSPVIALTYERSYWEDDLDELLGSDAEILYCLTIRDCLSAVTAGRADAALISNLEFNYQSKNSRFSGLIQWPNIRVASQMGFVALSASDNAMFTTLNKAISQLSSDQVDSVVNECLNMPYESYSWVDILYSSRLVLAVMGVCLIAFVIILLILRRGRRLRQAAEEEVRERERHQLHILAALSQDYSVVYYVELSRNKSSVVRYAPDLARFFEIPAPAERPYSEALAHYIESYVIREDRENLEKYCDPSAVIRRFQEEKSFSVRYQIIPDKRGQTFFEMHFADVSEPGQECAMVLGVRCVDDAVREEETQKQLLRNALDAANRASAAKSDFLSKMSHDIRTPMNAIIGMTAIAAAHKDNPDRVQDALSKIASSSRHLLGLINEVLDMSKVESGTISLAVEDFNLSEFLNGMLSIIQPQAAAHRHDLQVRVRDVRHENVSGDSLRIQQVFLNLVSNAIKYTPDGGKIDVILQEKQASAPSIGCYELIVEDNGIGMTKEFLSHIFEPFARAEDPRISKIHGTGLGLAITQNIVRLMDGTIKVESVVGRGSRFTVTFFLKLQETRDADVSDLADLRVLVADDDRDCCENVCGLLDGIGMRSQGCYSGEEAVEEMGRSLQDGQPFYAIILDWKMPGMDGVETARAIRALAGSEVPIIILSAYDWSEIEQEALAAGVDAFLSKPIFRSGIIRAFRELKQEGRSREGSPEGQLSAIAENRFGERRVLLVEDNELNREIAREILEMADLCVEEAENGKIAVDRFASSPEGYYDLIFMDIQMPEMNGLEASAAIRALDRPDAARIPIIAMTANAFVEDVQASKDAGMDDHLAKPIDFDKLDAVLKKYLGEKAEE